jgi:hypothetical protein
MENGWPDATADSARIPPFATCHADALSLQTASSASTQLSQSHRPELRHCKRGRADDARARVQGGGRMLPSTMRAAVLHGAGELRVEAMPVPESGQEDALVRVRACGICASDVHYCAHGRIRRYVVERPMSVGHEVAGDVAAMGSVQASPREPGCRSSPASPAAAVGCASRAGTTSARTSSPTPLRGSTGRCARTP